MLLLLAGCFNTMSPELPVAQKGSVVLVFNDARARTIVPDINLDIDHHVVSFVRTGYQTVTRSVGGAAAESEAVSLVPGPWDVTVDTLNKQGDFIGAGAAEVLVAARQTTSVTVAIRSIEGNGVLSLSADLSQIDIASPAIIGKLLSGATGAVIPITFTDDGSKWVWASDVAAGSYLLELDLTDSHTSVARYVNTVLIVSDRTTNAAVTFRTAGGSIVVQLVDEITRPIAITLGGVQPTLGPGDSMNVTASTAVAVDSYHWFLDGLEVGTDAQMVTVGPGLKAGDYLLTAVVKRGAIFSSREAPFSVTPSS